MWISYKVYEDSASVKTFVVKGCERVCSLSSETEIEGRNSKYNFNTYADHYRFENQVVIIPSGFSKDINLSGMLAINSSKPLTYTVLPEEGF